MKKPLFLFLILNLFLSNYKMYAQSDFAPVGAEWYHSGYGDDVVYKSYIDKDTIIAGQKCSRMLQKVFISPKASAYASMFKVMEGQYFYATKDTVFIFNNNFQRFTPLYVFNVVPGDTVRLNSMQSPNCTYVKNDTNRAEFSFVVDSVKYVKYDSEILKIVYSTPLFENESSMGWGFVPFGSVKNIYAEKIGSLTRGILPSCISGCFGLTIDGCFDPAEPLCYIDSKSDIHLISATCNKDYKPNNIPSLVHLKNDIIITPNPATTIISVETGLSFPTKMDIIDVSGKTIFQAECKAGEVKQLNVAHFSSGVYFIKISSQDDKFIGGEKFIKN